MTGVLASSRRFISELSVSKTEPSQLFYETRVYSVRLSQTTHRLPLLRVRRGTQKGTDKKEDGFSSEGLLLMMLRPYTYRQGMKEMEWMPE